MAKISKVWYNKNIVSNSFDNIIKGDDYEYKPRFELSYVYPKRRGLQSGSFCKRI